MVVCGQSFSPEVLERIGAIVRDAEGRAAPVASGALAARVRVAELALYQWVAEGDELPRGAG
jgi:hypothetical protein